MQGVIVFLGSPADQEQKGYEDYVRVTTEGKGGLFQALRPYSLEITKDIKLFRCANFNNKEIEEEVKTEILKIKDWAQFNINSIKNTEKVSIENIISNLIHSTGNNPSYNISNLKGTRDFQAAIIVGAGPSLEKNIQHIDCNRVTVLAVAQIAARLIREKIIPDYIISSDFHKNNNEHFDAIKRAVKDNFPPLICSCSVNYGVPLSYPGKIYYAAPQNPIMAYFKEIGSVETGMSVTNFAFNIAAYMGFKKIILAGQDLAYQKGKSHADGVSLAVETDPYITIPGYYGSEVKTDFLYNCYRFFLEEQIALFRKNYNYLVTNCTEGGAKIAGAEQDSLKNIMSRMFLKKITKTESKAISKSDVIYSFKYLQNECNAFINELFELEKVLEKTKEFLSNGRVKESLSFFHNENKAEQLIEKHKNLLTILNNLTLVENLQDLDIEKFKEAIRKKDAVRLKEFFNLEAKRFAAFKVAAVFLMGLCDRKLPLLEERVKK